MSTNYKYRKNEFTAEEWAVISPLFPAFSKAALERSFRTSGDEDAPFDAVEWAHWYAEKLKDDSSSVTA